MACREAQLLLKGLVPQSRSWVSVSYAGRLRSWDPKSVFGKDEVEGRGVAGVVALTFSGAWA